MSEAASTILVGGKLGDLIGRKRAYVLGLPGLAISFRMMRQPDPSSSGSDGMVLG